MPNAIRLGLLVTGSLLVSMSLTRASDDGGVRVEIFEGLPKNGNWSVPTTPPVEVYHTPALALVRLPARYNARGIEVDRVAPLALHATTTLRGRSGPHQLLLRARHAARLIVDGHVLAETRPIVRNSSGHEPVPPALDPQDPRWHALPPSGQERLVDWVADGQDHQIELWAMVGGKGLRNETGELLAAVVAPGGVPTLIGSDVLLTEAAWSSFFMSETDRLDAMDAKHRQAMAATESGVWERRHQLARRLAGKDPCEGSNPVDRHLGETGSAVEDAAFFRRLSLDTIGVIPEPEEVAAFLADPSPNKRARAIDARLADPRWADGWMGYWQDVLAENPGLLKPTLNNTGPFRRYLHNALSDNLPIDRLVTDLIRMDGTALGGGPAGFGLATQNDAPMAAKAQVLSRAFLAAEMKCARCHDAPFHPFGQEDLFGLAAMLEGKPVAIPKTSTVPRQPGGREPAVSVTLAAGDRVEPVWSLTDYTPETLPREVLSEGASSRDRLAALITSPTNQRFAPVVVNRLWHRYLGYGLVEPVDDWDGPTRDRAPELLADLARELLVHDYDLKHVARVILNSRAYQGRARVGVKGAGPPARRRLTAEQVLDSLFAAVGKPFRAEELCLDIDGRRPPTEFLNLGRPTRAWQLTLPSNERDRPALTLPVTSSLADILIAFGWRPARPDPTTLRESSITPLQPASMANGVALIGRIARLSDDSAITKLCLIDQPAEALVRAVVLRVLSRPATEAEVVRLVDYLGKTYSDRVVPGASIRPPMRPSRRRVSWSNHLHPDATRIQMEEEQVVRDGDPPTARLTSEFRERMEDIVWALVNSPEFVFIP